MKRILLGAMMVCVAGAAVGAAPWLRWQPNIYDKTQYSGRIDDPDHWYSGTGENVVTNLPGFETVSVFEQGTSYTLSFPADGYVNAASPFIRCYRGHALTFDTRGTFWRQPDTEQAGTETSRLRFRYTNIKGEDDDFIRFYGSADKLGGFVISNALMRYSVPSGLDMPTLDLDSGYYNFCDPNGASNGSKYFTMMGKFTNYGRVFVHPNAYFRANLRFDMGGTNELIFAGSTGDVATVSGSVLSQANYELGQAPVCRIVLTNGANVTVCGFRPGETPSYRGFNYEVDVGTNSVWTTTGTGSTLSAHYAKHFNIRIHDGGKLSVLKYKDDNGNDTYPGFFLGTGDAGSTNHIEVTDGTLESDSDVVFGENDTTRRYYGYADMVASNANIRMKSISLYNGRIALTNSTLTLPNGNLVAGLHPGVTNDVILGEGAVMTAYYVIFGSKTLGGIGRLIVDGGSLTTYDRIYLGGNGSSSHPGLGIFELRKGSVTSTASSLFNGYMRSSVLISGGKLKVTNIATTSDGANYESLFRMTGGEAELTTTSVNSGFNVADSSVGHARVALDGGVMKTHRLRGWTGAKARDGSGYAAFEADGGTLMPHCASSGLIETFDEAYLGDKGLTVLSDYDVTIAQCFGKKSGAQQGLLVLAGSGTKTFGTPAGGFKDNSYENLVLAGGKTVFTSGAPEVTQHLLVTNGATVAFGGKGTEVASLAMTNGVIQVSAGETITVKGPLTMGGTIQILFDDTCSVGSSATITSTEEIDDATLAAWQAAYSAAATKAGLCVTCTAEGKTLTMTAREAKSLLMPVDANTESNAAANVIFDTMDTLVMVPDTEATLNAKGDYKYGKLLKEGTGRVYLTGENQFYSIYARSGLLSADWPSFGVADLSAVTITNGTFEIQAGDGTPLVLDGRMTLGDAAYPTSNGVVLKVERPVSMVTPNVKVAAILKRGAGTLEFLHTDTQDTDELQYPRDAHCGVNPLPSVTQVVEFDDYGNVPITAFYTEFNVFEGEMRFKGRDANHRTFSEYRSCSIGAACGDVTAQPGIVVDDAYLSVASDSRHLILAPNLSAENSNVTAPYLYVTNHSKLAVNTLRIGASSTKSGVMVKGVFDQGSTFTASYRFSPNCNTSTESGADYRFLNTSTALVAHIHCYYGAFDMLFDNGSVLAKSISGTTITPTEFKGGALGYGRFRFQNGSLCAINKAENALGRSTDAGKHLTFTFDDATWYLGSGDQTLDMPCFATKLFSVISEGKGLILNPESGSTWTFKHILEGTGGMTVAGAGTVKLEPQTYDTTDGTVVRSGTLCVREGATLDVAAGAVATGVNYTGVGTVKGSLDAAIVKVTDTDAETGLPDGELILGDVTVTDGLSFDLGFTGANAFPASALRREFRLCRYSGTTAPNATWRVTGLGDASLYARLTAADGTLKCTIKRTGLSIIIR